jgi:hypothetical protein
MLAKNEINELFHRIQRGIKNKNIERPKGRGMKSLHASGGDSIKKPHMGGPWLTGFLNDEYVDAIADRTDLRFCCFLF